MLSQYILWNNCYWENEKEDHELGLNFKLKILKIFIE